MNTHFIKPYQGLCSPETAARMVREGRVLILAGAEEDLAAMPEGNWIGGTCGHFVTPQGDVPAGGEVFYADFTGLAAHACWRSFSAANIHELARHYPANGFAIIILPGCSRLLGAVAGRIMEYDGLYNVPLMGWVSAVDIAALPGLMPRVFAGGPQPRDDRAAVLYVTLQEQYFAQLNIANLFSPGTGPEIRFLDPGQRIAGDSMIGGVPDNLARYRAARGIDPRLPLVADHEGALLNVAIVSADTVSGEMLFLSPVSTSLTYRFAAEVLDYEAEFTRATAEVEAAQAAHTCICALHYEYAGLARAPEAAHDITAPVTFGQIAYTVLNQTLACLIIGRNEDESQEMAP